jgi:photosystem II stability/assembly factor-like uncharacterized protein
MFRKILILSTAIAFSQVAISQQGWNQLVSGTSYNLRSVCFTDVNTGYAVGFSGTILKTTNAGLNWTMQPSGTTEDLYSVHFIGQTGYIAGGTQYTPVIYRTTNGGTNWVSQTVTGTYHLHSVFMTDSETAHAVSDEGKIIRTTNGGINWTVQTINPNTYSLHQVFFTNANTGFIVGTYTMHAGAGILLRTDNGGNSWSILNYNEWRSIYFINSETGYGVAGGNAKKTTNSGTNWIIQNIGNSIGLTSIWFTNTLTGYTAGSTTSSIGTIFKTINGGLNWNIQVVPSAGPLNSVFLTDASTGYTVGNSGVILKTTNGGFTGLVPLSNEIPENYELHQNYPNPFNPSTKIKLQLKDAGLAQLIIYDILGRKVETLVNEVLKQGTYELDFDGNSYTSGIYYYKLISGDYSETKKMVLIK